MSIIRVLEHDNFATVASSLFPMLGIWEHSQQLQYLCQIFNYRYRSLDKQSPILFKGGKLEQAFYGLLFWGIFPYSIIWVFSKKRGLP